jgi:hypothetical protein
MMQGLKVLRMRRGIATLHPQVVSAGHNLTLPVRQSRADRQTALAQSDSRFFESFLQ